MFLNASARRVIRCLSREYYRMDYRQLLAGLTDVEGTHTHALVSN